MNPRALATKILLNVIEKKHSLSDSLNKELKKINDPRDRAFVQALCFGVCRFYFRLDKVAKQLLQKPLKQKDQDIYLLILIGLYQLIEMRLPDYAAISETVNAAIQLKKAWAKNFINAVLRNYQRQVTTLSDDAYSHPDWMIKKLQQDWPEHWEAILNANNQHPPLALRVNERKISRDAYLQKVGNDFSMISETRSGVYLSTPRDVTEIPGFLSGEVSVQDGAAQLAAPLLGIQAGHRILDACAAPGGKACHILEIAPDFVELIAIDKDPDRVKSIEENFLRLNLNGKCLCVDAAEMQRERDSQLFDRILLDAPCSATGVIRRHPDIKLLRQERDIEQLSNEQLRLLNALWPLLKSNGLMVYATCSVFLDENVKVIESFLASHPDAKEEKIQAEWGLPCEVGRQILPGMHGMDGFYYACLRK